MAARNGSFLYWWAEPNNLLQPTFARRGCFVKICSLRQTRLSLGAFGGLNRHPVSWEGEMEATEK